MSIHIYCAWYGVLITEQTVMVGRETSSLTIAFRQMQCTYARNKPLLVSLSDCTDLWPLCHWVKDFIWCGKITNFLVKTNDYNYQWRSTAAPNIAKHTKRNLSTSYAVKDLSHFASPTDQVNKPIHSILSERENKKRNLKKTKLANIL